MIVISVQTFHFAGPGIRVFFFQPDTDRASVLKTPKTRKNRTLSKYPVSGLPGPENPVPVRFEL